MAQGFLDGAVADWAGPYAGVRFGAVRSDNEAELGDFDGQLIPFDVSIGLFPKSIDDDQTSPIAGAMLGMNYQRGAFVSGVEASLSLLDHDGTVRYSRAGPFPPPGGPLIDTNTIYSTEIDTLAQLSWRGGFASGSNLFYVIAGIAGGQVTNEFSIQLPDLGYTLPNASEDGFLWGYALGIGFERRLTERTSIRAEITHFDLEDVTVEGRDPATPGFTNEIIDYQFTNRGTTATIGITFSF